MKGRDFLNDKLVKYDTELNTIPLRGFTPVEMNLFFSIVSSVRDKDTQIVRLSFRELKDLSDYKMTAIKKFISDLESTYDKLMDLRFSKRSKTGLSVEKFVMFTRFKIDGDAEEPFVDVQVHDMAIPLLNNLESWVQYSLAEFRHLKSGYSKTMFRLLKQFRTTGWAEFSVDDFRELLDIPKSYRQTHITTRVLSPIEEELPEFFKNFKIEKKYGRGRGTPVIGYRFTWKQEKTGDWIENKYKKRSKKKETLPVWVNNQVKADNQTKGVENKELQERLKKIRKNKIED